MTELRLKLSLAYFKNSKQWYDVQKTKQKTFAQNAVDIWNNELMTNTNIQMLMK